MRLQHEAIIFCFNDGTCLRWGNATVSFRSQLLRNLLVAGLDLALAKRCFLGFARYRRERARFIAAMPGAQRPMPLGGNFPCLGDWSADGGIATGQYFHQDLLVARQIHRASPSRHIDVGSRIDGFVAHLAAFRPVEVIDIRPLISQVPNLRFRQADMMGVLPSELIGASPSVSCLHALEHFGLGRYGDPIDVNGHLRGLANLVAMVAPGGMLYLSVPIGPSRIEFNAHRVFALPHLVELVASHLRVVRFSYVDDAGHLSENVPWTGSAAANTYGCTYGCGIIEAQRC